jgi:hypothetical protein
MDQRQGRQAVLIIHGMGEQRPMSTASKLVEGLTGDFDIVHPAPDRVSGNPDLRRVKVTWLPRIERPEDGSPSVPPPLTTDFYEMYWANLVDGTQWRHITSWLASLLPYWRQLSPRFRSFLSSRFRGALLLVAVAVMLLVASILWPQVQEVARWIAGALLPVAGVWVVLNIGDVARYFDKVAGNVTLQREIRSEGTELLRHLHRQTYSQSDRPLYDRIIVVGHSLGSVVAYDIVRDYWTEVYRSYRTSDHTQPEAMDRADAVDQAGEELRTRGSAATPFHRATFQRAQRELSAVWPAFLNDGDRRKSAVRWAVTDLVTLACPLAHADILTAPGGKALRREQEQRGLPTCPPLRQSLYPTYRFGYKRNASTRSWHQAALFAATRWTNVYFTSDVVGGPLRDLFGQGIEDVQAEDPPGRRGRFPSVHTQYDSMESALDPVRRVLWDGGQRRPLTTIAQDQHRTLMHVASELQNLPPEDRARTITSLPLLRRYSAADREILLTAISANGSLEETVQDAVARHPDLLGHIVIAERLLTSRKEPSNTRRNTLRRAGRRPHSRLRRWKKNDSEDNQHDDQ